MYEHMSMQRHAFIDTCLQIGEGTLVSLGGVSPEYVDDVGNGDSASWVVPQGRWGWLSV